MVTLSIPFFRFTLMRAWRTDRLAVIAVFSGLLAVVIASLMALPAHFHARETARTSAQLTQLPPALPAVRSNSSDAGIDLPPFLPTQLPDALNEAAAALALPVSGMEFRLDEKPSSAYIRYTATVKILGGYVNVRRFVDSVRRSLPQSSLDAIACTRADIRAAQLSCELTLSAFYRRSPRA